MISSETNGMIGTSWLVQQLTEQVKRIAAADSNVLICGETGTGKELVSEMLHRASTRHAQPLCTINCAAMTESLLESELFGHEKGAFTGADQRRIGLFERANRGTLFLDEVGELSLTCQAKLLRVLEGKPFERIGGTSLVHSNVRVIAATHRNLQHMTAENLFRQDLFFRLRVVEIRTPPLRDRGADIFELANHFLNTFASANNRRQLKFSEAAMRKIETYRWPGNVRELRNTIERATLLAVDSEIQVADLDLNSTTDIEEAGPILRSLGEVQRQHVRLVLDAVKGNKAAACRVLGISRATLYSKLGIRD